MENTTTHFLEEVENFIEEVKVFMESKTNSYDNGLQEKAYWSCREALELAEHTDEPRTFRIAKSLFERFKHNV